ncbi:MAG TPA: hypothetical protein VFG07_01040 [Thermoplasmata archaeon]|nr:hypothetical protein [Thermoplasmata archaeon]
MPTTDRQEFPADPNRLRTAEAALKRLGFSRVAPTSGASVQPEFWVQEAGVPRRRFPVFLDPTPVAPPSARPDQVSGAAKRAIVVVASEQAADETWERARRNPAGLFESELSILVVPNPPDPASEAHFHAGVLGRPELLRLATGVVVGLFRRAETGEGQVDFAEMLQLMRRRFGVDVRRSLGVEEDEDALFILYQLAQRFSWAPGDGGSNLHSLVLKPTGPAARLPWFAA